MVLSSFVKINLLFCIMDLLKRKSPVSFDVRVAHRFCCFFMQVSADVLVLLRRIFNALFVKFRILLVQLESDGGAISYSLRAKLK